MIKVLTEKPEEITEKFYTLEQLEHECFVGTIDTNTSEKAFKVSTGGKEYITIGLEDGSITEWGKFKNSFSRYSNYEFYVFDTWKELCLWLAE